jgi:hypothetical protein
VLKDNSLAARLASELGVSPAALQALGQRAVAGPSSASESTFALKLQFTLRDIHQEELKTISLDWNQAQPERRTAAPQGLLSHIAGRPMVVEAQDTGTFWDSLKVTVRTLGDLAALGVQGLVVELAYPDENAPQAQAALLFAPGDLAPKRFTAWTNGQPPRYRARVDVRFNEDGPWPGPPDFAGAWHTLQSLDLAVHPLSEVPRVELQIAPGTLSFVETPQAQVDLRLDGAIVATHMLTAAQPTAMFRSRLPPRPDAQSPPQLEARTTWFLAGGKRVEGPWLPVEGTVVFVAAPWRSERTLRVLPLLPETTLEALVTLRLVEPGHTESIELRFEPGERRAKSVTLRSLGEQPPAVEVDTLVIRGDGSSFVGVPMRTTEPVVLIRDRDGAHRQISVRLLAGTTLATNGLMAVEVRLLDADGATQDTVLFTESRRNAATLLVPVVDGGTPRFRVVRYAVDGSAAEGAIEALSGAELLVPAVVHS